MTNEIQKVVEQKQTLTISKLVHDEGFIEKAKDLLGSRTQQFLTSVLSLVNSVEKLKDCPPLEVYNCCLAAATLDLPVNNNLGFAHVIPYFDSKSGIMHPQFQMGYKGYIQLALRSGEYEDMDSRPVYENELIGIDEFTGTEIIRFMPEQDRGDKIVGYMAYFVTLKGFKKRLYMSLSQLGDHGAKYSKSYSYKTGIWQTEPDAMMRKTVLKLLLSRWGILSTQLQKAIESDQTSDGDKNYVDKKPSVELVEAELGSSEEDKNN